MGKLYSKLLLGISILVTAPAVLAQSSGDSNSAADWNSWWQNLLNYWNNYWNQNNGGGYSVPELDASTGPLAVTLIAVVVGIGLERNRRRKQREKAAS